MLFLTGVRAAVGAEVQGHVPGPNGLDRWVQLIGAASAASNSGSGTRASLCARAESFLSIPASARVGASAKSVPDRN
jgi:hypothetical protein